MELASVMKLNNYGTQTKKTHFNVLNLLKKEDFLWWVSYICILLATTTGQSLASQHFSKLT